MITKEQFSNLLKKSGACVEAQEWFSNFEGTLEESWLQCNRGDWMLWLLAKLEADRKRIVLSACDCARLVLHLNSDKRVLAAIETAEAWTRGEATLRDLDRAAEAAKAAEAATWATEAAWAAWAAWTAARAAEAATWAAGAAAWAAEAAKAAAWAETLSQCADIVRQHFSFDEVMKLVDSVLEGRE